MHFSRTRAPISVHPHALHRATTPLCLHVAQFYFVSFFCQVFALPAYPHDRGSKETEFFGKGAEITVIVRDAAGEPIPTVAMVTNSDEPP